MDADALREAQAPLREKYAADPSSAITPLRAAGDFRDDAVTCTVAGFAGPVRAGLHPAVGGDGSDACSGDMLLEALVACAGVTLRSVATAQGVPLTGATVVAETSFDARGTLGVSRDAPVGIGEVTLIATVTSDAALDDKTLARLARSTERYCVVGKSLATPPAFVVRQAPEG